MGMDAYRENANLKQSWDRHAPDFLDQYLVADVEDPRINLQSILTRSLLVDSLWPNRFADLIRAEMRFGLTLTWLLDQLKHGARGPALFDAILVGKCPAAVAETSAWLRSEDCPIVDYIAPIVDGRDPDRPEQWLADRQLNIFRDLWSAQLAAAPAPPPLRVVELACGSANDFRFLSDFGIARFLDYTGIDISEKNIENARRRFPAVDFRVGSALELPLESVSADFVFAHDLYEHLSLDAMRQALAETMRVARRQAWLNFFKADQRPEHHENSVAAYHWNILSIPRLAEELAGHGGQTEVLRMPDLARDFGFEDYYNREAATLIVTKRGAA